MSETHLIFFYFCLLFMCDSVLYKDIVSQSVG